MIRGEAKVGINETELFLLRLNQKVPLAFPLPHQHGYEDICDEEDFTFAAVTIRFSFLLRRPGSDAVYTEVTVEETNPKASLI